MKQFTDFIPLIVFFILYRFYDIYVATAALIIASAVQIAGLFIINKKVEKLQLVTFCIVTIFGGLTILLQNDDFIKYKVTIVYSLFAVGLMVSQFLGKSPIKNMLRNEIDLPKRIWSHITWAWVSFFALCAIANLYVAFNMSLDIWVNFKVFGLLFATFCFTAITAFYGYKHMPKDNSEQKN